MQLCIALQKSSDMLSGKAMEIQVSS